MTKASLVLIMILLVAALVPISIDARAASGQSTQLETLVQVATSSRSYASGVVDSAQGQGLDVSSFITLIASGNTSLAIAISDLSSNSNLTGGIQSVQIAMNDFTSAAEGASLLLLNSNSNYSFEAMTNLDSINSENTTATHLNSVVSIACATNPTNSSYDSLFQSYCSSVRNYLSLVATDLTQAHLLLSTGTIGMTTINQSQSLIDDARGNLSLATNFTSELSQFTYSQRVEQYLSGPFAQTMSVADNAVTTQSNLVSTYRSDLTQFQTFQGQQSAAVNSIESSATSLSTSIYATLTAATATGSLATAEETDLSTATSDVSGLSSLVGTLPQGLLGILVSDITNVQSAITTSGLALASLNTQASSFNQLSLSSIGSYSTSFQSAASSVESDNQALLSSIQTLETSVTALATTFVQLAPWESTLSSLYQTLSSDSSTLSTSAQSYESDITASQNSVSSYESTTQSSSSQIEVSTTLTNSVASVYSSESAFLNAAALAQTEAASTSLQGSSQTAASFVTSVESLSSANVSGLSAFVQTLSSSGSSLVSQTSSTLNTLNQASTVLSADLQTRSQALASANADISEVITMFDDLQISQGASLLVEATVQLQIASQIG